MTDTSQPGFYRWNGTGYVLDLTNASEPAGTATGDLTGYYPSPTVDAVTGVVISGIPQDGYVIAATSSTTAVWQDVGSGTIVLFGDVTGAGNANTVVNIQGNAVKSGVLGVSQDGYVLTWKNSATQWQALPSSDTITLLGDVTGVADANTVVTLTGSAGLVSTANSTDLAFLDGSGNSAHTGTIRLPDASSINVRNHANNADLNLVSKDSSNNMTFGDSTGSLANTVTFQGGNVVDLTAGTTLNITSGSTNNLNITGGIAIYFAVAGSSDPFIFQTGSTIEWQYNVASPIFTQVAQQIDSSTHNLTIQAQSAYTSASTHTSGANLVLQGGVSTAAGTGVGGVVAISSGQSVQQLTISASTYTIDTHASTSDYVIFTDSTSNTINITLPIPTAGRTLIIKDKTGQAATNNITITQHASETIDGASTYIMTIAYESITLCSDSTNWSII